MDWERHFRGMRPKAPAQFSGLFDGSGAMSGGLFGEPSHVDNGDNMRAVNDYFHTVTAQTPQARQLQSDWMQWWITTGNPDNFTFFVPDKIWDEARNRRLAFNLANAITPQEKENVIRVATTGVSSETIRSESEKRDPVTGQIFIPPPPPFNLPKWFFPVVVGTVALVVVGPLARKIIFPI